MDWLYPVFFLGGCVATLLVAALWPEKKEAPKPMTVEKPKTKDEPRWLTLDEIATITTEFKNGEADGMADKYGVFAQNQEFNDLHDWPIVRDRSRNAYWHGYWHGLNVMRPKDPMQLSKDDFFALIEKRAKIDRAKAAMTSEDV